MRVTGEITYPTDDPEKAFALVVDKAFRAEVCVATHAVSYDVALQEQDGGGAVVTITREVPAAVPAALRSMVGETVEIVQTESWGAADDSGTRVAGLDIKITGQPVKMSGTIRMAPQHGAVVSVVEGELKVAIPFFGKKVEPDIAKAILTAMSEEQRAATKRLAG